MFECLKADYRRQVESFQKTRARRVSLVQILQILVINQGYHALLVYRFGQFARRQVLPVRWLLSLFYYPLAFLVDLLYGIRLSSRARIGCGFYIGHFGGVVVGECVIGSHVSIYQRVVIEAGVGGMPRIGDRVWIGAHSRISGPVRIADRATVAAGSLIAEDLPEACMAAGNPTRIIKLDFDNSGLH